MSVPKTHHNLMVNPSFNAYNSRLPEYVHMYTNINVSGAKISDLLWKGEIPLKSATCTNKFHRVNLAPLC